ncbi:MAG: hypothetical protein ACFFGZ_05925 [Candidatus Thorarchaeota archaeon]
MQFVMRFPDKSAWNEMKTDLKALFSEIGIRYRYTEKKPTFRVLYGSSNINVEVAWAEEGLLIELDAKEAPSPDHIPILEQIFDLFELFGGELSSGARPEAWKKE